MIIAFIPVRGGSKSIPLKNIRPFCGKPLVCWNIEALEACDKVGEIVIATDSDQIEQTVISCHFNKVKIYRRTSVNATDTSSTESVMLEYINYAKLPTNDVFMLVQATSPLTQSAHFTEALRMYAEENYDSVLSCVRSKRFFWNFNGTTINYNYTARPRRQDFPGILMENGAFYINTVENILASGNRLSGRIGIYEMPEYTAFEIDEPDDWVIMESIMRRHVLLKDSAERKKIKLFLCDVDGTLTDGGMYYSASGEESKKFNTRDGMAFKLLRDAGIKTGIITSENTPIVTNRAKKLKTDFLIQDSQGNGKLSEAVRICKELGITISDVAYIGDDINCIPLLEHAGVRACPSDAQVKVKDVPGIQIMTLRGGEGCVREFAEKFL